MNSGTLEVRLGEHARQVQPEAVVFIAARVIHGFENIGGGVADILAVFPSRSVDIRYPERNPAPGTGGQAPTEPFALDVRTLAGGSAAAGIRPVDEGAFVDPTS